MSKKIKKWEDLDESVRDKLKDLREKEREFIEKSGYKIWKSNFMFGFAAYSAFLFLFLRKRYNDLNLKLMCLYLSPMIPYGFLLKKTYFN